MDNITTNIPSNDLQLPHIIKNSGIDVAKLGDSKFHISSKIDIILGAGIFGDLLLLKPKIPTGNKNLHFFPTRLGYVLAGKVFGNNNTKASGITLHSTIENLNANVERFWALESFNKDESLTNNDNICEQHFKNTFSRNGQDKFILKLPFLNNKLPDLGYSKQGAFKRFINLEKRFYNDRQLESGYFNFINEYRRLGVRVSRKYSRFRN